jgi:sugar/nucleoside kinase (ribokinase family)
MNEVVIVGSVALDTIDGPGGHADDALGGSASYAAFSASFYAKARIIACVGPDFPAAARKAFDGRNIDLAGLETVPGKTFRWAGEYAKGFVTRETKMLDLGVFGGFKPAIKSALPESSILFLANIDPDLQMDVLEKAGGKAFVAVDTIDHWIRSKGDVLKKALARSDVFFLNDEEARLISGEDNLVRAGKAIMAMGPKYVVLKKGEHGAMLFSAGAISVVPALPLEDFRDPTGAGDTYAGAMLGYMAREGKRDLAAMRTAMAHATVMSSFVVEDFSMNRLRGVTQADIDARLARLRELVKF